MKRSILILAALLAFVAIGPTRKPDVAAGRAALIAADAQFAVDTATRGLDGWLSYFAPDATIFPSRGPIVSGLDSIRAFYSRTHFSPEGLRWKPLRADIAVSGELGYTYGTWDLEGRDADDKPVVHHGKYTTIWKKQLDRSWRVALDIGAPDAPPASKP